MAIVCLLLRIYTFVIFARLILSWFPQIPESIRPIATALYAVTEPVLRLARPLIPPVRIGMGAMDLSPILVFVVLGIISQAVCAAA
ncbi:MAG TPA: YggT family protein [Actinomycetota bacterium]|nr:YggT family protein [Actinomycetota bacterium]